VSPATSARRERLQPRLCSRRPRFSAVHAIIDPELRSVDAGDAYCTLREAVHKLGHQAEYDPHTQTTHSNDGMTLEHTKVQSINDHTATVDACYTYTHSWYVDAQNTQHAPGASEATPALVNVHNTWYLHGVTGDHTVPRCAASTS
jgi:hypothetical protein